MRFGRPVRLFSFLVLVPFFLGLSACGSPSAHPSPAHVRPKTTARDAVPVCKPAWLRVTVPHPQANKVIVGSGGTEHVVVATTRRCALRGWPMFAQVPAGRSKVGTRPGFVESRRGHPATVVVRPHRPATARVAVRLPKRWAWRGGNLCAGFVSAVIKPASVGKAYFVFDASPVFPSCGMPAAAQVHVVVWPFRAA